MYLNAFHEEMGRFSAPINREHMQMLISRDNNLKVHLENNSEA